MPPISLLIKPASGNCNMRCKYCFYTDEMAHREVASYGFMSLDALEVIMRKVLDYADIQAGFGFQGGEPTLMGVDFYRSVMEFEMRYAKKGTQVYNTIQTNGYLINDQWADFFSQNQFLVGLSMDGIKTTHDLYRKDAEDKETFQKALHAAHLLASRKVAFNILTVVTPKLATSIGKIYGFYKKNQFLYQQYIPCLDSLSCTKETGYRLSVEQYSHFLKQLFQLWYMDRRADRFTYIRYFENLLMIAAGQPPESCSVKGTCINQLVVEADGSVYPCDFYVLDEWKLGNLLTDSLEAIISNKKAQNFINESTQIDESCYQCRWRAFCGGGCKRERALWGTVKRRNYYCAALRDFLEYAYPKLVEIIRFLNEK